MKYFIVMQGSIIDVAYNIKQAREQAETWSKVWRDWVNVYTKSTLKCAYDDGRYVDMHGKLTRAQMEIVKGA
jgi:hypothetical protein